jgi:hypothetical protein
MVLCERPRVEIGRKQFGEYGILRYWPRPRIQETQASVTVLLGIKEMRAALDVIDRPFYS